LGAEGGGRQVNGKARVVDDGRLRVTPPLFAHVITQTTIDYVTPEVERLLLFRRGHPKSAPASKTPSRC